MTITTIVFKTILNDSSQQITTLLYIKRACELNKSHIISTDEDPGLRIESIAVINLRGVSTNKTIIVFRESLKFKLCAMSASVTFLLRLRFAFGLDVSLLILLNTLPKHIKV